MLTAHPTEARRRTIIAKLARIFGILRELDERVLLPDEVERARQRLAHTIEEVWYSEEVRATELTVLDEVRTSLVYFLSTFVEVIPRLYRDLEEAISAVFPHSGIVVPPLLMPGTWIGGDRDGNPNVTPEVTSAGIGPDALGGDWTVGRASPRAGRSIVSRREHLRPGAAAHPAHPGSGGSIPGNSLTGLSYQRRRTVPTGTDVDARAFTRLP